jgi:menaquinone-dependent protoporphyrinogen oxidase
MKYLVIYATREGHTRRIAEHIGATLRAKGYGADVRNVSDVSAQEQLTDYQAVVLGASLHAGQHEREMVDFVRQRREELQRVPTAFLSVSLTEAGAEDPAAPQEKRAKAAADVQGALDHFYEKTGWRPERTLPVAGALLYSQYGRLTRVVMRMISKRAGGDTDTSRDYVYTDWDALDRFVGEVVGGSSER